jgi:hypothetical protein
MLFNTPSAFFTFWHVSRCFGRPDRARTLIEATRTRRVGVPAVEEFQPRWEATM